MRALTYIIGVVLLIGLVILGYTQWFNTATHTDINIDEKAITLLGDVYGMETFTLSLKGTLTSSRFDPGGLFLGEVTLAQKTFTFDSNNGGLSLALKDDLLHGNFRTNDQEVINVIFTMDFSTGYFKNDATGQLFYYPYSGERLLTVKQQVDDAFEKLMLKN